MLSLEEEEGGGILQLFATALRRGAARWSQAPLMVAGERTGEQAQAAAEGRAVSVRQAVVLTSVVSPGLLLPSWRQSEPAWPCHWEHLPPSFQMSSQHTSCPCRPGLGLRQRPVSG